MKKQERNRLIPVLGIVVMMLTLACFAMLIVGNDAAVTVLGVCMFAGMLLLGVSDYLPALLGRSRQESDTVVDVIGEDAEVDEDETPATRAA